ncbi:hypothetical protein [Streptomyces milbemycinicus]|uniref:hypothetical protein n=1 Tax=Streptomyces milbemycinicus TaxID=476552 RepID=UPI0033FBDA8A
MPRAIAPGLVIPRRVVDDSRTSWATNEDAKQVQLLILVNATAAHDRTEAEDGIVKGATGYFVGLDHATQKLLEAEAAAERAVVEAASRVRTILRSLRRYDAYTYER